MAKPLIKWKPVQVVDPSDRTRRLIYPSIVDRQEPLDLTQVVANAIDTGRIPGLKTSAAESIARGTVEQIGVELRNARGIKFGDYFYVRPYLSGTLPSMVASLSETENKISTRLVPGAGLRLTNSDFSFSNVAVDGDTPRIDVVTSDVANNDDGALNIGETILVVGRYLNNGTFVRALLRWTEGEAQESIELGTPASRGDATIKFEWPESGTPGVGKEVTLEVTFMQTVDGVETEVTAVGKATIVA